MNDTTPISGQPIYKRNWLTKRDIERNQGELYLTRYVLFRTPWFGVYLHKFHISDYPVPHDHPYNFISIPLKGGYREHFIDGEHEDRGAFSARFRSAREFHWVELRNGPSWSLFIHFKRKRTWGFMTPVGWVDWKTHNKNLGLDQ